MVTNFGTDLFPEMSYRNKNKITLDYEKSEGKERNLFLSFFFSLWPLYGYKPPGETTEIHKLIFCME